MNPSVISHTEFILTNTNPEPIKIVEKIIKKQDQVEFDHVHFRTFGESSFSYKKTLQIIIIIIK